MKKVDLHCHTTASDGIKTPSDLIDCAIANNLCAIAITDHDTINGLSEAIEYSKGKEIHLIPGIEFSIAFEGGSFHLVGLYIDHTYKPLIEKTSELQKVRDGRIYRIIEDLAHHGIDIPVEDVLAESDGGTMGRPHVARVLVKYGYASNITEVFRNYLVKGKPGYVPKQRIPLDEAISLIKGSGGIPILAHPVSLNYKSFMEFENLLKGFVDAGVEGIEIYSSMHKASDVEEFKHLAKKYNLFESGGSDFHGDKDEIIGYYLPSKPIPYEIFEELQNLRHN
ncbi:MAG TPA: PHP domain-containing protein [Spirochaetota bacterium]|nr:PHP domain-containing protein [Spirochaetota bacterium]